MPSDDDKVVARIADKYALFMANEIGEPMGGLYDENSLAAIREAIQETRKQTLEMAAKAVCGWCRKGTPMSSEPDLALTQHNLGTDDDPDYISCRVASIRALLADSKDVAEGTEAR